MQEEKLVLCVVSHTNMYDSVMVEFDNYLVSTFHWLPLYPGVLGALLLVLGGRVARHVSVVHVC